MIRNFTLIVLSLLIWCCSSENLERGFTIYGNIANFEDQYLYYPKHYEAKRNAELDSVFVEDGKFELSGKVEHPVFFGLMSKAKSKFYINLVIENSEIYLNADAALDYQNRFGLRVKGSVSDSLQHLYQKDFKEAINEYGGLKEDKIEELIANLESRIHQHSHHWMSLYAASDLCHLLYSGGDHQKSLEHIIKLLRPEFSREELFKKIEEFCSASEKRKIGEKFISFEALNFNGDEFKLEEILGKSYVFVDCWASWCGPCRKEMPRIKEIYQTFKLQDFQVLSVSFDSDKEQWEKALLEDKIGDFINVSELSHYNNIIANTYRINRIPDNFLLDKDGKIIGNGLSPQELEDILKRLYQ